MIFQQIKDWLLKEKTYIDHWFEIDERWRYLTVAISNVLIKYLIFFILMLNYTEHYQFNLFLSWFFFIFHSLHRLQIFSFCHRRKSYKRIFKINRNTEFQLYYKLYIFMVICSKTGKQPLYSTSYYIISFNTI